MSKEVLDVMDKQIVSWVEELDALYEEIRQMGKRIDEVEGRLSALKIVRRALAAEWGADSEEVSIPLQYTSEGVREAIHEVVRPDDKPLTVIQIVVRLKKSGYNFGDKNPRRVVNMALINDPDAESTGHGGYIIREGLPF